MATRRGDLRVLRGTMIHGPMTRDQLAGLVAAGRVAGTDLVSMAEGPWSPVAAYLGGADRSEAGDGRVEGVGTTPTLSSFPWHYARGGSQLGPVSIEQLKELAVSGSLSPTDLIWREGLPDWRPAGTLRDLFPEAMTQPAGPPPLPTAPPAAASEPSSPPVSGDPSPSPIRKPDFFDRARDLTLKAKAKAEAFQREAQAKAEKMRQNSLTNPAQEALSRGVKAAVDYARSDEAKELARKARETAKGGAVTAATLAGVAAAEGRDRARKVAEHPLSVGAALLCLFPLGLYLVWHHPRWTRGSKWAWTGAWLGCSCLLMLPAMLAPRAVPKGWPPAAPAPDDVSGGRPPADAPAPRLGGPSPPRLRSDEQLIQGRWNSVQADGSERPQFEFRGDTLVETGLELSRPAGKFVLDPGRRPRQITWQYRSPGVSATVNGIYEFRGDELFVRLNYFDRTRLGFAEGSEMRRKAEGVAAKHPDSNARPADMVEGAGALPWDVLYRLRRARGRDSTGPPQLPGFGGDKGPRTSGITSDDLRARIVGEDFRPRGKFFGLYGEPERVVDIGDNTYLYYTCKDGKVVIACPKGPYQYDDDLAPLSVDRR